MADTLTLKKFEALSPFKIKDERISLAKATSRRAQSASLNAGPGNPNWVATTPREGFFLLGQFAITEGKRVMEHPAGIGGMPQAKGIAARFEAWLAKHSDMPGAGFLSEMLPFAVEKFGFDPDAFVHDLVDSIIGDNYPVPDRMLLAAIAIHEDNIFDRMIAKLPDAPGWSLRISLANLPDDVYDDIGRGVRSIARGYRDTYEAAKGG